MNELKNYVDVNRESFEVYEYAPEDWNAIAAKLDETKSKHKSVNIPLKYIWRAAAVVLLAFGAVFYTSWINWRSQNLDMMMSNELREAEFYYNDLIAVKVAEIGRLDRSAEVEVFRNMEELDQAFLELKRDLEDNADNEEVLLAMMNNYKIKLEILEQILQQLEARKAL
ncbi:MAG: hypothetical protein ABJF11_10345 [Reichenbachiella sp.]|uniref:hypothetical protein n=1 Tax=Reichenbachiella sp. TaxID=2184521 RepID=UPI003263DC3B